MTSNPLARRRSEPANDSTPRHRTMQEHADYLNATITRNDLEWIVGENGLFLRDKPSWTFHRTRELERKAEASRQEWKRAQKQGGVM